MTNLVRSALLSIAAAALAGAATYKVNMPVNTVIDGQELKAGDYKIEVTGESATIKGEGRTVAAKVTTETTDQKNDATSVKISQATGKNTVQSINIGGKNIKLVFDAAKTANGGM